MICYHHSATQMLPQGYQEVVVSHLITSMGEVLIDFLPLEESGRTVGFRMHPGGSLLNVAVAAARLGQPVALATTIATDFFGRFLRAYAEREGVDPRWLIDSPALSTLAFVAHEGGEPVFNFYGEGTADTLLTPEALPEELFAETAILHVGSISLLRGSTPAAVQAAVERLRGRALISLDPNLRPGLVKDEAPYRALLDRFFGLVDLVKISAADLGWLMPRVPVEEAARTLLARGPALVVITRGGAGVLAVRAADQGRAPIALPAFSVTVADTVGAGDSFNGGLLTRLAEAGAVSRRALEALPNDELAAALRFAAAVAAINCTRPGADPPRRAEVEAFLADG
jgi:fructokinase